jgi:hypothetical protein
LNVSFRAEVVEVLVAAMIVAVGGLKVYPRDSPSNTA